MQPFVGGIAAGEPEYLGWRAELVEQVAEIGVFGEDHDPGSFGGLEDFFVFGIAQAQQPLAGIGLSGVRNRVALLGGELSVVSRLGRGTIISFGLAV